MVSTRGRYTLERGGEHLSVDRRGGVWLTWNVKYMSTMLTSGRTYSGSGTDRSVNHKVPALSSPGTGSAAIDLVKRIAPRMMGNCSTMGKNICQFETPARSCNSFCCIRSSMICSGLAFPFSTIDINCCWVWTYIGSFRNSCDLADTCWPLSVG